MSAAQTLRVDRIRCDGRGACAELLPERIQLDDWGYPIVDPTPIRRDLVGFARQAVATCPVLALRLQVAERSTSRPENDDAQLGTIPRNP